MPADLRIHNSQLSRQTRATRGLPPRRLRMEALEDRWLLVIDLVSASLTGGSGTQASANPIISDDGRFVVFESGANNLVANDLNPTNITDIFRRDLVTGQTVLVNPNTTNNGGGNANSGSAVVSADGRYIAFVSAASNLQTGDTNGTQSDVFFRDVVANTTTIISRNAALTGTGSGASGAPSISRDGRYVVFQSQAPDLVAGGADTNGTVQDVFLWDRLNPNINTLLSVQFDGLSGANSPSSSPIISGNGQFITFVSQASNLVNIDTNGSVPDVFVRATGSGPISLVSIDFNNTGTGFGASVNPTISDDGNWIVFSSVANNLVTNDTNGTQDIFLRNRVAGATTLVSIDRNNQFSGNGFSANGLISDDGQVIAFTSTATNLIPVDNNGFTQDVFVRNRTTNTTLLVSVNFFGTTGNSSSTEPDLSFDGRYVTFSSTASDLITPDTNGFTQDVFRRDMASGVTIRVSTNITNGGSGNNASGTPKIDDSGQNIAFSSMAFDLVTNDTNLALMDVFRFTPVGPSSPQSIVTGPEQGATPTVLVLDAGNFSQRRSLQPYGPTFGGGVRVATADISGDGVLDIITAAGPGGGPHVRVFDGVTGNQVPGPIGSFFAYAAAFTGGVFVAAGDVTGDGRADIITGAGAGGGPHVKVFNGVTGAEVRSFFAYAAAFTGGVFVAAGDVNADNRADIITGAGPSGGPHVRVFSGANGAEIRGFFAYSSNFTGGVFVSAGDINADGRADVITGAGPSGGPHVRVFNIGTGTEIYGFFGLPQSYTGGVRVGSVDANNDGRIDIITASGSGISTTFRVYNGVNATLLSETSPYPTSTSGLFVAGTIAGLPGGSPLRAAGSAGGMGGGRSLDSATLAAFLAAALARLNAAGVPESRLESVHFVVANLPGDYVGLAAGSVVYIDRDAAGRGWFVDPTPQDDVEFQQPVGQLPRGIDLLTAVWHEVGHALGLADLDPLEHPADAMAALLQPGVRRTALAALDAVFADSTQ